MVGLLSVFAGAVAATPDFPPADAAGWHTWQVDEPNAATQLCCFSWRRGEAPRTGCDLDGEHVTYSDNGDCAAAPGTLQIFVRFNAGKPAAIRALSSSCAVSAKSEVVDHGLISSADSMTWFRTTIEDRGLARNIREEALFVLVQSESDAAYAYLDRLLGHR